MKRLTKEQESLKEEVREWFCRMTVGDHISDERALAEIIRQKGVVAGSYVMDLVEKKY